MSEAEQDYLEKYLNVLRQKTAPDMPDDEFFERFCGDQILKTRDLDVTELASGVVGGPHDGGVDSVYLFANGRLIQEDTSPTAFSEQQDIKLHLILITATRSPKFSEVGYPFDSGSHKMLWSRESIYQEANPEVTALARRGAA